MEGTARLWTCFCIVLDMAMLPPGLGRCVHLGSGSVSVRVLEPQGTGVCVQINSYWFKATGAMHPLGEAEGIPVSMSSAIERKRGRETSVLNWLRWFTGLLVVSG